MKYFYAYLSIVMLFIASFTSSAQVLISEDYEGITAFPSSGWSSGSLPPFTVVTSLPCEGSRSVRGTLSSSSTTPILQYLTQVTTGEDIEISFDYKLLQNTTGNPATGTTDSFGSFYLEITTNGGATWEAPYFTIDNTTHTSSTSCATLTHTIPGASVPLGTDFGWRVRGDFTGAVTGANNYMFIDNFRAVEQVDCIQPVDIVIGDVTFDSIEVSWEDLNTPSATEWNVAYCPVGSSPGSPVCSSNIANTTLNPYTITGLNDGTVYDIYVQTVCGPGDESVWTGPIPVQTVAIGTDCANAFEINQNPGNPVPGDLPFTHTSDTDVYGNTYSGQAGINCGSTGNFLDGFDVVYHYVPSDDDILQIELSNLIGENNVGVFVYEDCADIGSACFDGATTNDGSDFGVSDLFVTGGQDYYIVISTSGPGTSTEYTLDITGFDCLTWQAPDGNSAYEFVPPQTLAEFSGSTLGVNVTINGATLAWYEDDNGAPGVVIPDPDTIVLTDGDVYWVTQNIGTCESAALEVTFNEFDCLNELEVLTTDAGDSVCDFGIITLGATANTTNIYWYDAQTDGEVVGTGGTYTTPVLTQSTSYWAAEVFFGEGLTPGQAHPGPNTLSTATTDNAGVRFDVTSDMTIVDVQVFVTGSSGNLTIDLIDEGSGVQVGTTTIGVPGGSASVPTPVTIPLNFDVTSAAGPYRLVKVSGPSMIYSLPANTSYPYPLGNAGEVTSGFAFSGNSTSYYYFYNWTIREFRALCESDRVEVVAVVHEIIDIDVVADDLEVCVGQSTNLTASSTNSDYGYTWTWPGGTDTGSVISVSPTQPTTYTVTAVDAVTGCETQEQISLGVIGSSETLAIAPDLPTVCVGQVVELTAGAVYEGFEGGTNSWTTTNSSSGASAAWSLEQSPHTVDGTVISSNDNSQFYFSDGRLTGTGSTLNTTLVSPSFNLVGVSSASLNFYHYYRNHPVTTAYVEVSLNGGAWGPPVQTYNTNEGTASSFARASVSLNSYVGNDDVRVRFRYQGQWGWWWAIDNVTIKRNFTGGQVTWSPVTNLYLDQAATNPYTGGNAPSVYFYSDLDDDYTFTATVDINGCSPVLESDVTVMVMDTPMPVGDPVQFFEDDETLGDLMVTGTGLVWYGEDEEGQIVEIPAGTELVHGTTYYVTQTLNYCESEMLPVLAYYNCPVITDLQVVEATGTTATLTWTEPAAIDKVEHYDIRAFRVDNDEEVFSEIMLVGWNIVTITGLEPTTQYYFEIFTICNGSEEVFSTSTETVGFETGVLSLHDINFAGFAYYPNPTAGMVNFSNNTIIDKVEVFNVLGQKLMEQNGNSADVQMDFGNLATGVYMTKVSVGESVRLVRIIKE